MKKILIYDDEARITENLAEMIEKIQPGKWEILKCHTKEELEEICRDRQEFPEILFIDIELDSINGIDIACMIQKKYPWTAIVFITGYMEYAQEIFRVKPVYMLLKPFDEKKIESALSRAEEYNAEYSDVDISISNKGTIIKINCKHILYAESNKRKVKIITNDGEFEEYIKISELLEQLPANFVSCHKSYMVNMSYIKKITTKEIILVNDEIIPVSKTKYKKLQEKFMKMVNGR